MILSPAFSGQEYQEKGAKHLEIMHGSELVVM